MSSSTAVNVAGLCTTGTCRRTVSSSTAVNAAGLSEEFVFGQRDFEAYGQSQNGKQTPTVP